jgi:hypothetical protein
MARAFREKIEKFTPSGPENVPTLSGFPGSRLGSVGTAVLLTAYYRTVLKTTTAFCPPKPMEFFINARIGIVMPLLGT